MQKIDPLSEGPLQATSCRLPEGLHKQVKVWATSTNNSIANMMRLMIEASCETLGHALDNPKVGMSPKMHAIFASGNENEKTLRGGVRLDIKDQVDDMSYLLPQIIKALARSGALTESDVSDMEAKMRKRSRTTEPSSSVPNPVWEPMDRSHVWFDLTEEEQNEVRAKAADRKSRED